MVHLMGSGLVETMKGKGGSKKAPVKPEFDDSSEPLESLYKRPKLDSSSQVVIFTLFVIVSLFLFHSFFVLVSNFLIRVWLKVFVVIMFLFRC